MRRFIIDTDTASDDAVALLMALQHPDVQVDAITIVAGNVALPQASINARYCVEVSGVPAPVYDGCAKPLVRSQEDAKWFHGQDGMGNMNYPAPGISAEKNHAVDELVKRFAESPGEITLVTLGPLTNIAAALVREPRLAQWVKQCYVMGGAACTVGNVTPAAEYNIWCDPEAARIVFHSGMPILMVGWEHCRGDSTLTDEEIAYVYSLDNERAQVAMDCNKHALVAIRELQGEQGMGLPDPVTMAIAIDPTICTKQEMHFVDVACESELTRGLTVVDQLHVTNQAPNIEVCWEIDHQRWKNLLYECLS